MKAEVFLPNILDTESLLGSVQTSSSNHCDAHGPSHIDFKILHESI